MSFQNNQNKTLDGLNSVSADVFNATLDYEVNGDAGNSHQFLKKSNLNVLEWGDFLLQNHILEGNLIDISGTHINVDLSEAPIITEFGVDYIIISKADGTNAKILLNNLVNTPLSIVDNKINLVLSNIINTPLSITNNKISLDISSIIESPLSINNSLISLNLANIIESPLSINNSLISLNLSNIINTPLTIVDNKINLVLSTIIQSPLTISNNKINLDLSTIIQSPLTISNNKIDFSTSNLSGSNLIKDDAGLKYFEFDNTNRKSIFYNTDATSEFLLIQNNNIIQKDGTKKIFEYNDTTKKTTFYETNTASNNIIFVLDHNKASGSIGILNIPSLQEGGVGGATGDIYKDNNFLKIV